MAIDISRGQPSQAFVPLPTGGFKPVPAIEIPIKHRAKADTNVLQGNEDDMPVVDDTEVLHRSLKDKIFGKKRPRVRELEQQENLSFKNKRRLNGKPDRAYLITMRFSNGTRRTWVIISKSEFFTYRKRMYYLFYENAFYDLTHHVYHLDYFDDYSCPIDRSIFLKADKDAQDSSKAQAFFSVTPSNLKPIIKMEYVKALADSQSLSKYMKFLVIVNMAAVFISGVGIYLIYSLPKKLAPIIATMVTAAMKAAVVVKP
jgi:hypothetical protein